MQEELARPFGFVGGVAGVFIGRDMHPDQEGLTVGEFDVAVLETDLAGPQGFDLGAGQD